MARLILTAALAVTCATGLQAEPAHGTIFSATIGGDGYAAQFWTGDGKLMVARQDAEAGKGAFPPAVAAAMAQAALDAHGMSCALDAPKSYLGLPDFWEVYYRC